MLADPACSQEDLWLRHSHPDFKGLTPIDTKNFGKCKSGAMRALTRIGILVALAALAVGVLAATGVANPLGKGSQPEKVKVLDDFYKPTNVKIKKNKKVKWKWGQDFNTHNVTLKKGPKGVKKSKFTSQTQLGRGLLVHEEVQEARQVQLLLHDSPRRHEDDCQGQGVRVVPTF